jgi:hypothetical protein
MASPATRTAPADAGEDAGRTGDAHSRPAAVPDLADDLADMLRRGRMAGVKRVTRLTWVDEDGNESSIALPVPKVRATDDMPDLKDLERDILRVLRASGRRMLAMDIAGVIDPDQDPYDGSFSRALKRLKELQLIDGSKADGGYALKS